MRDLIAFTTPLMRSSIGFDRFNDLFESMIEGTDDRFDTYPPYNIEKAGEDQYRIVMAVAGFTMKDLNITTQREALIVSGKAEEREDQGITYLHRGIAARAFQRTFRLADHIKVTGAEMHDGLLTINLVHEVPEEAKPRMIPINSNGSATSIDGKKQKTN
jgi:molecular chaperone IbpA